MCCLQRLPRNMHSWRLPASKIHLICLCEHIAWSSVLNVTLGGNRRKHQTVLKGMEKKPWPKGTNLQRYERKSCKVKCARRRLQIVRLCGAEASFKKQILAILNTYTRNVNHGTWCVGLTVLITSHFKAIFKTLWCIP